MNGGSSWFIFFKSVFSFYDVYSSHSFKVIPGIEEGEEGDDDVMEKEPGAEGEKKEGEKEKTKEYEDDDAG